MSDSGLVERADAASASERAYAEPLETLNPAQAALFQQDAIWPYFERLRREDPVHYTPESDFAPHWSVTKYNDIMAIDTNHSSAFLMALPPGLSGCVRS